MKVKPSPSVSASPHAATPGGPELLARDSQAHPHVYGSCRGVPTLLLPELTFTVNLSSKMSIELHYGNRLESKEEGGLGVEVYFYPLLLFLLEGLLQRDHHEAAGRNLCPQLGSTEMALSQSDF